MFGVPPRDARVGSGLPRQQLLAFERVTLRPGQTTAVQLTVGVRELAVALPDGRFAVPAGEWTLFVNERPGASASVTVP